MAWNAYNAAAPQATTKGWENGAKRFDLAKRFRNYMCNAGRIIPQKTQANVTAPLISILLYLIKVR